MNDQELKHYGVPGMKWGRRKATDSSSPKANYKRKIKQAKEDYKQANVARARAKLNRDIQGPQGKTVRDKAKSYVMSEAQNKAAKLKSQIDYEDAVERAGKEYRQELRERGQAKKEIARAKREAAKAKREAAKAKKQAELNQEYTINGKDLNKITGIMTAGMIFTGVVGAIGAAAICKMTSPKTVSRSASKVKDIIDATDYKVSDAYEIVRRMK